MMPKNLTVSDKTHARLKKEALDKGLTLQKYVEKKLK